MYKYSIIGKQHIETITQSEYDRYPQHVREYNCELDAIKSIEKIIPELDYLVLCGTHSFIYVDKIKDNIFSKKETIEHLYKKVKKDYKTIIELNILEELTAKQKNKKKTSESGLRSGIAVIKLLQQGSEKLKVIITTRNLNKKLSIANYIYNAMDIGSGDIELLLNGDEEIIKTVIKNCEECEHDKFCLMTSGSYEERCQVCNKVKEIIIKYIEENKLIVDIKKILYRLQPIRREVEKCSLLTQRDILMKQELNTMCLQGGNRDGFVMVNGKFVGDIKIQNVNYENVMKEVKNLFEL
tara:strand:- start:221 stop:1111 length:891 start_codon:yes stop_codon:yes gene_type:complete